MRASLAVIAKSPAPGRVKTRLCPPCSPGEAARLAEAALRDTLAAVLATRCARRLLVLDGEPGRWVDPAFEVISQRGDTLDERLAAAFDDVGGPALLIGMDTPQVTPALLRTGLRALATRGTDAVLGPALDGGYWAIGLRQPDRRAFLGVPMSTSETGGAQLGRLTSLGLRVRLLPELRDVDRIEDARAAAESG
ncbi:MAG: TIGR04282 family arsenosugar biosynthesis glycosyltransferase, partial [Solirubrobacterales bacterium]